MNKSIINCNKIDHINKNKTIDITNIYQLINQIEGGLSGALVYIVSKDNIRYILKYYNTHYDTRTIRELISLCYLSGTDGFPKVYDIGYCKNPIKWSPNIDYKRNSGYYIVMNIIDGEVLDILDIKVGKKKAINIIVGILYRMIQMREIMGSNFEHYDLHPNNIIVDMNKCENNIIKLYNNKYIIDCPKIYIIDYDLAIGGKRLSNIPVQPIHRRKQYENLEMLWDTIPLNIVHYWIKWEKNIIELLNKLKILFKINSRDIKSWIIISYIILKNNGIDDNIEICKDIEDCIKKNSKIFESLKFDNILKTKK
jgi:hypothetical protein